MNDRDTPVRHAGTTSLVDLLDRVIDRGAVISGDVIIALAGVDLVRLDLRLLLTSVQTPAGTDEGCPR
nr:gas vesicle protein [uncultured Actinoplanes sp.]